MKLFFCMRLDTHKYLFNSVHSYRCGQAHLDTPKVIHNIES